MIISIRIGVVGAVLAAAITVSGCLPVAATGVAVGALSISDRRSLGTQTEDAGIELKGASRLREAMADVGHISVTSYNRRVLLTGQVPDNAAKTKAESVLNKVDNVRAVQNELEIVPRPNLGSRANDVGITARVKAALVETKDVQAHAVKIVTEAGTVYLMGLVTKREGDRAAQVAARVGGVQRVVTVFDYLSEEDLSRMGVH
jgi:osmotically-inducible protein OsmY